LRFGTACHDALCCIKTACAMTGALQRSIDVPASFFLALILPKAMERM
jgi:hypothetical protein